MRMKSRFEYGEGNPQSGLSRRKHIYIQYISYCIWAHRLIRSLTWTYRDRREEEKKRGEVGGKVAGITREMSYMLGEGSITGSGRRRKRKVDSMRRILTGS